LPATALPDPLLILLKPATLAPRLAQAPLPFSAAAASSPPLDTPFFLFFETQARRALAIHNENIAAFFYFLLANDCVTII
jgi:hypothetical protein